LGILTTGGNKNESLRPINQKKSKGITNGQKKKLINTIKEKE